MTNVRLPSIHAIAEELRASNEQWAEVVDDFACLKAYFKSNNDSIEAEGIKVSEKLPKTAELCSYLCTKSKMIAEALVKEFDMRLLDFNTYLLDLKQRNPDIAAIAEAAKKAAKKNQKAAILENGADKFDTIEAYIRGANFGGIAKQAGFLKGIEMMIAVFNDEPVDEKELSEEFIEMYTVYKTINGDDKREVKDRYLVLLEMFAKVLTVRRCPIAVNNVIYKCANFIREFPVKPLLDFLKIQENVLVLHAY